MVEGKKFCEFFLLILYVESYMVYNLNIECNTKEGVSSL
jgi:hypothetical protein